MATARSHGSTSAVLVCEFVAACQRGRLLVLDATPITDEALQSMRHFIGLKVLSMNDCSIWDAGLAYLHENRRLEGVTVIGTQVSRQGAEEFQRVLCPCIVQNSPNVALLAPPSFDHLKPVELPLSGALPTSASK